MNLYFSWTYTILHSFTGNDGAFPMGGLSLCGGILYGTASSGGPLAGGSVFSDSTGVAR